MKAQSLSTSMCTGVQMKQRPEAANLLEAGVTGSCHVADMGAMNQTEVLHMSSTRF